MTQLPKGFDTKKTWYIYLIRCSDGSYYCGSCVDPVRRLHEHNHTTKGARYTRSRRPVFLVYCERSPNRAAAYRRESYIKQLNVSQKISLINPKCSFSYEFSDWYHKSIPGVWRQWKTVKP